MTENANLSPEKLFNVKGIFHFSPLEVVQDPDYKNWAKSFVSDSKLTHIMLNENSNDYGTCKTVAYNAQQHMIAPDVFLKSNQGRDGFKQFEQTCLNLQTVSNIFL